MARHEYSFRTGTPAALGNIFDVAAGATNAVTLWEVGITNSAATAATIGLVRTTAVGTRTTPTAMITSDSLEPPAAVGVPGLTVASAWSVAATLAANYLRRADIAAAIGAGLVWQWYAQDGLFLPVSASVMFVNLGAAALPALDVYLSWEE